MIPLAWAALLAAAPAPLVDVARLVPDVVVDLRYAAADNVLGRPVYPAGARCLLLAPVAERLARAAARLRSAGLRLRLWDCYRPLAVQRELWRHTPHRGLVADPSKGGSNHNRGAAVDVALASPDGAAVALPSAFDDFGPHARVGATAGISAEARRNRELLRAAMLAEGFRPIRMEWWHFDAPEARGRRIVDAPLAPRAPPP